MIGEYHGFRIGQAAKEATCTVTAFAAGTVRYHENATAGKSLLSFSLHREQQRYSYRFLLTAKSELPKNASCHNGISQLT